MARVTIWGGIAVLVLLAAGMTEATMAPGPHGRLTNDSSLRPVTPSPTATPTSTPMPTPAPTATPMLAQSAPTATTNGFVHMRASNSTSSAVLIDLSAGTVVELLPYIDASWQQVRYNGTVGYLWKAYLTY
ncbi:MAG: hypothetical protein NVSMB39_2890 [Candidatus Saccharimonadales bacterium]